jgi:hypothetical protein
VIVAAIPGAAYAGSPPVAPEALVIPRAQMPGFQKGKRVLEVARTPGQWASEVLEDPPVNDEEEQRRLITEGFREGVRELLELHSATAFSAALLLGSPEGAANEAAHKASEGLAEFGKGARRFAFPALPGAYGIQQTHPKHSPARGLYVVSIALSEGDCTGIIGAFMPSYRAARLAATAGAVALDRRITSVCG